MGTVEKMKPHNVVILSEVWDWEWETKPWNPNSSPRDHESSTIKQKFPGLSFEGDISLLWDGMGKGM